MLASVSRWMELGQRAGTVSAYKGKIKDIDCGVV